MRPLGPMMILIPSFLLLGCVDSRDQRLAELAQETVKEQTRQNERTAMQGEQVARASRELVAADAKAREQMIETHAALQRDIEANRVHLTEQRDVLEEERRSLALQRFRDPLIAQAIGTLGLLLACLMPLVLAAYVLYVANQSQADDASLNEILISEIVSDRPTLLPAPPTIARIAEQSSTASNASGET